MLLVALFSLFEITFSKPPNIVFILTDDQDVALFGYNPMPKAKALLADAGMSFTNMFVSSPICCPSRSSILTGKFVHNHLATNNSVSGNCSSSEWQQGPEQEAFPVYLKYSGYNTFFAGKYLNQYGKKKVGGTEHIPPGWDEWNGLVGNSVYYNYSLSVNGKKEEHKDSYKSDYLTDVIHRRALDFLDKQKGHNPFFLMLSTPACHQPFDSAPQYMKNFTTAYAPRTKNFNVHGNDKHWLIDQAITPMPNDTVAMIDDYFRKRWRTLLSVDDMIEGVVEKLRAMKQLNNTYIFFTSDNGYHLGQFSLPYDKRQLYDFDIRVPLIVRGPNITAKSISEESVMNIDLAPTFLDIARQPLLSGFDGVSLVPLLHGKNVDLRDAVLVEYHGEHSDVIPGCPKYTNQGMANCDAHCVCEDSSNNTYGCVRYDKGNETYKYCALQDDSNFVEVYDLKADPYELTNLAKTADPDILSRLSQMLAKLSTCSGPSCYKKKYF